MSTEVSEPVDILTYSVEEDGGLPQNVLRLYQLPKPVAEQLVAVIHLD